MAQIPVKLKTALCPLALTLLAAQPARAQNFWQQTQWDLLPRTVCEQRSYLHGARSNGGRNAALPRSERNDFARECGLGLMANMQTGFTPGPVGFGLDAHIHAAWNMDKNDLHVGKIRMLPLNSEGYAQSHLVRGGAALKIKLANTIWRVGEQRAKSPIFSSSDTRLLPETMHGWQLTSRDLAKTAGLTLHAAHYTGSTDRHARSTRNPLTVNYLDPKSPRGKAFDLLGAQFAPGSGPWTFAAWLGRLQDTWHTTHLSGSHTRPLQNGDKLTLSAQTYRSANTGRALAGPISTRTTSAFANWKHSAHTFGLGWQKVNGNTPFDYVTRGAIWLDNAMQLSDFNAPHEQSWQLRHTVDWSANWQTGLAYTRGSGTDGSRMPGSSGYAWLGYGQNGKHWERDLWLRYTAATGRAKGLALLLRYGEHRANAAQAELDTRQIRLSLQYPMHW